MDVKTLAKDFTGFLAHHSTELSVVASTLETLLSHLPIDAQDKARISTGLDALQQSAANIANAAAALSGQDVEVVVSKADVEAAVAAYLDTHRASIESGDNAGN